MKNNVRLLILFSILLNITACKKNSSNGQVEDNTSSEKSNAETIVSDNKSAEKEPEEVKAVEPFTRIAMDTSMGVIEIDLNAEKAPITVANFLSYVDSKHFDGTIFHRVMQDFMIQGGGFTVAGDEKETRASIKNEGNNGLSNERGSIAMARANHPDSATAQFFINVVNNDSLDGAIGRPGYAVFGKVVSGMDVVDAIREVKTGPKTLRSLHPDGKLFPSPNGNVPMKDVEIKTIKRAENSP